MPTPTDRLGIALAPRTPEVEALVARHVAALAAELGDLELVEEIATMAETPDGITTLDLAERAGITERQARTWTTSGYLVPNARQGTGSGFPITYPTETVLKARLMGSLVSVLRMAPGAASHTAEEILATGRAHVGPYVVTRRSLS